MAFHFVVNVDGPGEEPHTAGARAVFPDRLDGGFVDAGIADEAEVIVGREHQELAAFGFYPGARAFFQWELIWVNPDLARLTHHFEDPAGTAVDQILLL